ncbi:MAG: DMT family transporter [Paracoccaceae bacterium]
MTYRQGMTLGVTAAVIWSLMPLLIRLIGEATPWQVLFYRSAGAVPLLLAVILAKGDGLRPVIAAGRPGMVGGIALVVASAGAIIGIQATTVANAVFLFSVAPLLTAILAFAVLGEPVRPRTWAALALAAIGVFVMVREGLALGAGFGNLAAIASAAGFAVFTIALRWGHMPDMVPAVLIGSVLSMAVSAAAILAGGDGFALPLPSVLIALAMGAAVFAAGLILFTIASRAVPASELGLVGLVEVTLGPIWVWLLLGETASAATLAGGAILLAALAFNTLGGAAPARAGNA